MTCHYIVAYSSPNKSNGRPYGIESITIHHWGATGQKFMNVVKYLCREGGNTSAHYVAEAGQVACIVDPDDRAWHAGHGLNVPHGGNATSIGIECRPERSAEDFETVAELIADLRDTYGDLPLYPHSHWTATGCPGLWKSHLTKLSKRADEIRASRKSGTKETTTTKTDTKKTSSKKSDKIDVDGKWGAETTGGLQTVLGTTVDHIVSDQPKSNKPQYPNVDASWEWVAKGTNGSAVIKALQKKIGAKPDGFAGYETAGKLQTFLGVEDDHVVGPKTVTALQKRINSGKF